MIDSSILDKIIPVPTEEEAILTIKKKLDEKGYPVNNYRKGGVMYGLLRIIILLYIQLLELARTTISQCYMKHSTGAWKDIKAADYGKTRKPAQKTQGYLTITRDSHSNALTINKGHGFKTMPDANGYEYKFYCMENTLIPAGQEIGRVLVEAENTGSEYNLPADKITVSMIYIDGGASVTNKEDWLQQEAADEEPDENLTERCLNSYAEMARRTTAAKLKSVAEEVTGVINAMIDDQHPRGQGTTDIIITGTAGEATDELLRKVAEHTAYLRGNYDDYEYKSATVLKQDITMTLYLAKDASVDGVAGMGEESIRNKLSITRKELNVLYLDDIRFVLKDTFPDYRTSVFAAPENDVIGDIGVVVLPGAINIDVRNMG